MYLVFYVQPFPVLIAYPEYFIFLCMYLFPSKNSVCVRYTYQCIYMYIKYIKFELSF